MRTEGTVVTCASLVRRDATPVEAVAGTAAELLLRLPRGDAAGAQLARFAVAGVLATSVQVLLFTALAPGGALLAHLVSWGASTAIANELHRRRTFRAEARVGVLTAQLEGGGLALLGLLVTAAALGVLTAAAPQAGVAVQTFVVLAVTAAVGLLRFAVLRWSFVLRRPRPA